MEFGSNTPLSKDRSAAWQDMLDRNHRNTCAPGGVDSPCNLRKGRFDWWVFNEEVAGNIFVLYVNDDKCAPFHVCSGLSVLEIGLALNSFEWISSKANGQIRHN